MDSEFLTDEEINAYVQYEAGNKEYFKLTEARYAEIGEMIRSSELYQKRYEQSKKIYDEIIGVKDTNKFPFLAVAASLLILVLCTAVYYFGALGDQSDNLALNNSDLPPLAELNERYGLNETLDNRVFNPLRGLNVKDIEPRNEKIIKEEVVFTWESKEEQKLTLKVYDKSEKVIHTQSSDIGKLMWEIPASNVYYWSLEDDFEVFHWGKFYGLKE